MDIDDLKEQLEISYKLIDSDKSVNFDVGFEDFLDEKQQQPETFTVFQYIEQSVDHKDLEDDSDDDSSTFFRNGDSKEVKNNKACA